MKKLVCLVMLFALGCPVFAYPVQWSEICPSEYLNATTQHNPASYILKVTRDNNKEADYWANRKIEFDRQVQSVLQLPQDQQDYYYNQIRMAELNKNNAHYQCRQNSLAQQGLMLQRFGVLQTMYGNASLDGINNSLNSIKRGY